MITDVTCAGVAREGAQLARPPDGAPRTAVTRAAAPHHAVEVSIVIVSWNTVALLRDCLRSIQSQTANLSHEVIVVDNGSADGSAEMVAAEFPHVCLLGNVSNLGFAAANNQGIAIARGRYVLLLNSDTVVLDEAIPKAVAFADQRPDVAVVGCRAQFPDGRLQRNCYRFPSLVNVALSLTHLAQVFPRSRFLGRGRLTWWDYATPREVDAVAGCFMLVRRAAIDQVGPMTERFFMYSEDTEWCWRFRQAGWRICYTPEAVIVHVLGASARQCANDMRILERRSLLMFLEQRSGKAARYTANALFLAAALARLAILGAQWLLGGSAAARRQWPQAVAALRFHLGGDLPGAADGDHQSE